MVWTAPATWVAGAVLTAGQLNTQVRDNLKAIGDTWTAFGSGASWTAATTNPVLGNGTWDAGFMRAGKLTSFYIQITMGSTTTYGAGAWQLALPVATNARLWLFHGLAFDSSLSDDHFVMFRAISSTVIAGRALPVTAGNPLRSMTSTVPFTWATGDQLCVTGLYESV